MKRTFFFFLFIHFIGLSQTKDELDICFALQSNSFSSDAIANNALDRILNTIGASKNFVLTPCSKISNAVATAYKGERYILYDSEFMKLINLNTNDWSSLFILAHEVGHHINGHSLDILLYAGDVIETKSLSKKRQQELEADEFAAFVLAKLGASLSQLTDVIKVISDDSDDTYSTHPKRSKRLKSVEVGFRKGFVKKETKTVYIDSKMKNYESSAGYVKYGSWFRKFEDDIFEGSSWESITSGVLRGDKSFFNQAPLLKIIKTNKGKQTYVLEFENVIDSIFKFIVPGVKEAYGTFLVQGKDGSEIYRNVIRLKYFDKKSFTFKFCRCGDQSGHMILDQCWDDGSYTGVFAGGPYNVLTSLKKGSRLLVKIESYNSTLYPYKGFMKPEANTPIERVYFEYSLSGSSKALAE